MQALIHKTQTMVFIWELYDTIFSITSRQFKFSCTVQTVFAKHTHTHIDIQTLRLRLRHTRARLPSYNCERWTRTSVEGVEKSTGQIDRQTDKQMGKSTHSTHTLMHLLNNLAEPCLIYVFCECFKCFTHGELKKKKKKKSEAKWKNT